MIQELEKDQISFPRRLQVCLDQHVEHLLQ